MSVEKMSKRLTAPEITDRKGGEPIVSLTSYHAHTAAIADKYVDFLLVGDSLGMVMHGFEQRAGAAGPHDHARPRRDARRQAGAGRGRHAVRVLRGEPAQAFRNAARVIKETECGAIKLEGGRRMAETIRFLTSAAFR